jgi:predicted cupin superfamily sugar epimerase
VNPPPEHPHSRAAALVANLGLQPHPEGGWYAEVFRSTQPAGTADGRAPRVALTTIDFLLARHQHSAWHRVLSDEVWHLLEGEGLRLWLAAPDLGHFSSLELGPVRAGRRPRAVVPAGWWQAAEPLGDYAYVGATVGPGFDFADFRFGREDAALTQTLADRAPLLQRLL